ncbi:MAG: ABC transporter ATP-binding protein [Chloroflexi bacterium]|nr:ABC transporter ATP-binding protein [Chloroflexota bacterium]
MAVGSHGMTTEFSPQRTVRWDQRGPIRWILSHALPHKAPVLGILVGALGNAALAGLGPLMVGQAFDAVIASPPDLRTLAISAIVVAGSQLLRGGLFQLMRNFCSELIGQRVERDVRDELYASLLGKSMSFHDSQPAGDVLARATNDVREINLMFNPGLNLVIGSLNFLFVPVYTSPTIHPQLVIIPLVYLGLYGFLVRSFLRQLAPKAEVVRQSFGAMNATLSEAIEGIETVKGAVREQFESGRFSERAAAWRDAYVRQADVEARFIPLLMLGLLQTSGLLHSLLLFRAGIIPVGAVISYNGLLLLFGFPTFATQFAYARVSSGIASARRILQLITAQTELDQNTDGYAEKMHGEVRLEGVCFRYDRLNGACQPGEHAVALEDISFSIASGQTVAIVGQTGSGKSTISKLINRTYDVNAGKVLIDGIDVREWDLAALRRQISVIEQDIFLFSRTIAENIAFGRPGATMAEVEAAARAAQAHEFISGLADGYDTVIGERGATLSGGQRQRLALARAFLTDPAILVLDDSTSAIDSATEDRIQKAIEAAARDRTTFLITHRLSQIRWADLIIVLRSGRLEAIGNHEQLMASSPAYRRIFAQYED